MAVGSLSRERGEVIVSTGVCESRKVRQALPMRMT
jgi:hypothetical protein